MKNNDYMEIWMRLNPLRTGSATCMTITAHTRRDVLDMPGALTLCSSRESRSRNISRIEFALNNGWISEDIFSAYARKLYQIFGNRTKYLTAMREIERSCEKPRGYCYKPDYIMGGRVV